MSNRSSGAFGRSSTSVGVFGTSAQDRGVLGFGPRIGVHGICDTAGSDVDPTVHAGVYGQGADFGVYCVGALGLYSESSAGSGGTAGYFKGPVYVEGDFTVLGAGSIKAAAVPHPDGTYRRLCAVESPEAWLEDFGRGEVREGRADVALDEDFATLIDTDGYHVFLTPEGESNGLYVGARTPTGFEVREQAEGTSSLGFSYRVVARRGDVKPERLEVVKTPPQRTPPAADVPEVETESRDA